MERDSAGIEPGHDAESWAKQFDDPTRDAWQRPAEVLDALRLEPTDLVADLGAGTGYFSAHIAKRIPKGKLFAITLNRTCCATS